MIETLLNVPKSPAEWSIFGFAHAEVHRSIRAGLAAAGFVVGDYVLDPIPSSALQEWLGRVQQAHDDMNGALNLQSNNLEGVNFDDPGQAQAWFYLNWQEDNAALAALQL